LGKSNDLTDRKKCRKLTQAYTDKNKKVVDHTLTPYFGKMKLDKITGEVIDRWLDVMIKEGKKNSTTNGYFGTLQTMIKWAVKKRIINRDPFLDVQRLLNEKSILSLKSFESFCSKLLSSMPLYT
jgi:site-specific recombinase XerD